MDNHIVKNVFYDFLYRWGQVLFFIGLASFSLSTLALTSNVDSPNALYKPLNSDQRKIDNDELNTIKHRVSELEIQITKLQAKSQTPLNSNQIMIDGDELNTTKNRVSDLEVRIKALQGTSSASKAETKTVSDKKSEGMSFEVWTGILLACSALLLTILGIGIALLSVFGYRKIVKSSSESAQKIAAKVAQETSVATANEATSIELQRLIAMGAFNAVIREAIETISYRGLQPLSELDDQEL